MLDMLVNPTRAPTRYSQRARSELFFRCGRCIARITIKAGRIGAVWEMDTVHIGEGTWNLETGILA